MVSWPTSSPGLSFFGEFTRVEMGHTVIGSVGNVARRSAGGSSSADELGRGLIIGFGCGESAGSSVVKRLRSPSGGWHEHSLRKIRLRQFRTSEPRILHHVPICHDQSSLCPASSRTGRSNTAPPAVQSKAANAKHSATIMTERNHSLLGGVMNDSTKRPPWPAAENS